MSESGWRWWASEDGEHFSIGPCATKVEVIRAALDERLGLQYRTGQDADEPRYHRFEICEGRQDAVCLGDYFDAEDWLRTISEDKEDLMDMDGESAIDTITNEQGAGIQEMVRKAIRDAQLMYNINITPYRFSATRNREHITFVFPVNSVPTKTVVPVAGVPFEFPAETETIDIESASCKAYVEKDPYCFESVAPKSGRFLTRAAQVARVVEFGGGVWWGYIGEDTSAKSWDSSGRAVVRHRKGNDLVKYLGDLN